MDKMKQDLVELAGSALLAPVIEQANEYARRAKADNTLKAYRADWQHFSHWCAVHRLPSLPASPEAVALYLADLARTYKPSTLQRRMAAISIAHEAAGQDSPTKSARARETLKGIKRTLGTIQDRKAPVRAVHLRQLMTELPGDLLGLRDRALLLVGYAGAFRRSELVALDLEDIEFVHEGIRVALHRSKTDQEGEGTIKAIGFASSQSTCPVRALQSWLDATGINSGPIFRPVNRHGQLQDQRLSDKAVDLVVKRCAPICGLDPDCVGGHSLRAGLVTDLYAAGIAEAVIMGITGHRSRSVLGRYRREADLFAFNHIVAVGL